MKDEAKVKAFYDGGCAICSREIAYYQKIANPEILEWIDIDNNPSYLDDIGISRSQALKILHVQETSGDLKLGIDAFTSIWSKLPGWKYLSTIVKMPGINESARFLYNIFSEYRFRRLVHRRITKNENG